MTSSSLPVIDRLLSLRDGSLLRLRSIRPQDRDALQALFGRLSPRSRYMRFFSHKAYLSERELEFFSHCDGHNHIGLIGFSLRAGVETPVGVVRCIRMPDAPQQGEIALAVADDQQGQGLGALLLEQIVHACRGHDFTHLRLVMLQDNQRLRTLLKRTEWPITLRRDDDGLLAELCLAELWPLLQPNELELDQHLQQLAHRWVDLSLLPYRVWLEHWQAQAA